MTASPSEAEIQQVTLLRLGSRPDFRCWRNNVGAMRGANGRVVRFGLPGSADIMGVLQVVALGPRVGEGRRVGVFVAIELKSATGRMTPDQERFRAMVLHLGGVYILARSADQAELELNAARDRIAGWLQCR